MLCPMQKSFVEHQIHQNQIEPQARSKIFQIFQSFTSNKEASLQIKAIKEIENL